MNTDTLKNIFKAPYQSNIWKDFLKQVFREISNNFFENPIDRKDESLAKHKDVDHIWEFGDIELADQSRILFYEVVLKDSQQVTRNRVGLRNIIHSDLIPGYVDGIIVTYHNHIDEDWRFTFISKSHYWDEENNEVRKETHPKRYTYLMGENETVKTAIQQFSWLIEKTQSKKLKLEDILQAFSVEKISREFYAGYFKQYRSFEKNIINNDKSFKYFLNQIKFSSNLEQKNEKAESLVSDFVKKFLGRIVFLYFLQKKGWMGVPKNNDWGNGQRDFLAKLFEEYPDKNNFYSKVLIPLFFETLNEDRSSNNDIFEITNSRIPYLNGGLFEKDQIEPVDIQFDPEMFSNLFDFFNRFNFTVDENSPDDQSIGVDPEMLGHIFENLLEENRKKQGAFYTPKEIVHYMTQESLIEYLCSSCTNTTELDIINLIKNKEIGNLSSYELVEINNLLSNVKICDPSIGSGAFPMGLLHEIFTLKGLIAYELKNDNWQPNKVKEEIIENSIYGVDLNDGAVDIARLRFWLSLVVDEPTPRPLPNLDYKIITGDSLISRYSLDTSIKNVFKEFNKSRTSEDKMDLLRYKRLVIEYMHEANHNKKEQFRKLIEEIKFAFKTTFEKADKTKISMARGELTNLETSDMFGKAKGSKKEILAAKKKLKKLEEQRLDVEGGKMFANAVEWRFEFPNLLDEEGNFNGFDIVIGNPPYIQLQKDGGYLANLYQPMKFEAFSKMGDIYCLFYEQGIKLLKEKGVLSYITSNQWMLTNYGKALRNFFIKNTRPKKLLNLGEGIFKSATVNTNILIVTKDDYTEFDTCKLTTASIRNINQFVKSNSAAISFKKDEAWPILSANEFNVKNIIENIGTPLKDWDVKLNYGIKTGLNDVFIIDEFTKNKLTASNNNFDDIIRPVLSGKDLKRYKTNYQNNYILFIPWHFPLHDQKINGVSYEAEKLFQSQYPAIYDYLASHKQKLSNRNKSETGKRYEWYALQRCANTYREELKKEKIVWGNLATSAQFSIASDNSIINAPSNMITPANKYLLAILNSRLGDYYIKMLGVKRNGGYYEYKPMFVEQLPVPQIPESEQEPFEILVDYVIYLKQEKEELINGIKNSHIASLFEDVIDGYVFELYFKEHMKEKELDISKIVNPQLKPINDVDNKSQFLTELYQYLRKTEATIRIKKWTINSPEILKLIIQNN